MTSRAEDTRAALLAAAAHVFVRDGYADANVADVVAEAGASVGSLYHHFGAKADLYVALYEDWDARQEHRSSVAVAAARRAGESDPGQLFLAGARAYLAGCRAEAGLTRLVHAGDGPPGFALVSRQRTRAWSHANHLLLQQVDGASADAMTLVLTTVLSQAGLEVSLADDDAEATRLAEDVLAIVAKIVAG